MKFCCIIVSWTGRQDKSVTFSFSTYGRIHLGTCKISPEEGTELRTKFSMTCEGFENTGRRTLKYSLYADADGDGECKFYKCIVSLNSLSFPKNLFAQ